VPRLIGQLDLDGVPVSLETAAVGRRLRDVLNSPGDRAAKLRLVGRIGEWILELGRRTRTSPEALGNERERLRGDVVGRWSGNGTDPELVDELPPVSPVTLHNDLGSWNVIADDDGDFVVVDWENARDAGLPLWDLFYFLGDALALVDGSSSSEEIADRIVRLFAGESPSSPFLFEWVRRAVEETPVPPESVGRIATLCWLSASLSVRDHNADLVAWTPRDPPRAHGIEDVAHAWMAHPALGPSWNRWRG
jgi:hypothetical protein